MKSLLNLPLPTAAEESIAWRRLLGSAPGLAIAEAARATQSPLLVVARDVPAALELEEAVRFFRGSDGWPVRVFPDWECLPYDVFSPHAELIADRLSILARLPQYSRGVILVAASTLLARLPPRAYVAAQSFQLRVGDTLEPERLRHQLTEASYQNVSQVMEPGEYAVRGGLIDLYPIGSHTPYRIDLFGETIESIREFDAATQRSSRALDAIELLPAREFPLTDEAIQRFRQSFRARFEGDPQRVAVYRDISRGIAVPGIEFYLPLFFEHTASLLDYLPRETICILDDGAQRGARGFWREINDRYEQLRHDVERPLLSPNEVYWPVDTLLAGLNAHPQVLLIDPMDGGMETAASSEAVAVAPPPSLPIEPHAEQPYHNLIAFLRENRGRVLLVAETPGRRETLRSLLAEHGVAVADITDWTDFCRRDERIGLTAAPLARGLTLHGGRVTVITEPQLYGERVAQRRRRRRDERDAGAVIRDLTQLRIGDAVVHEDHGVGRYRGLQMIDVGNGANEFVTLEYADGDKLYVPVLSLQLLSRYTGTDAEHAPLHKLGGDAWDKAKQRALRKAHDAAAELLEIHALRAARQGIAFPPPDAHYRAFAEEFPFEETPDQARAIDEVLADMTAAKSMDRLVCGDVGFGKTEVAMRAAFLAAHAGKQVAVLIPTTLLAQQHYQNFCDRFAGTPYRIELLSRFRSKAEQAQTLAALAAGTAHIVVGTHRLLQPDVRFAQLGLIILDEEHRFGVRQKERLKQLRAEVDILTLTATPIPRSLNMALAGLRDISLITTAPEGRLSVKTLVNEWDRGLIREACLREIRRGGQVYYLHNEVRTIERTARELQELLPEATVQMAHGQMPERELEHIMLEFYHRRFNILVCSTIIESGIDVPTANTIIIERADKLGLAQLHQLRGRVGRSHHRAYAYLLIPPRGLLSAEARRRLEAIESLEELGAGFALASQDLEIRGAGELLGESQSGEIDEIGFTLYAELLARAVQTLQRGGEVTAARPPGTEVDLHAPALLPENYVPDVHMRLVLYKRIASAASAAALQALQEEVIDRFGMLPEPGLLLFQAAALKLRAAPLGVRKIDAGAKGARIEFVENPPIDATAVLRLLQSAPRRYRLDGPNRLRVIQDMPDAASRLKTITETLSALTTESKPEPRRDTSAARRR
ncbi:MAG: transcription-repair coupling factor [Gammaproteobacteria bacterium]